MAEKIQYERFDYGDGDVLLQRECPDCDRGLLLAPARFCSRCGGSGFLVTRESPGPVGVPEAAKGET